MLIVEDLNAFYGRVQALFNISLEVKEGEVVVVLGPNGAGKTTLLKSLVNIDVTKSGRVIYNSLDITRMPTYKISKMGIFYMPDYGGLLPGMTVWENLQLAGGSRRIDVKKLKTFYPEILNLLNRRAEQLSGGERKIIAMLRALIMNPRLLLLDEPTEGVAPIITERIVKLIKTLNEEEKLTILWVEPGAKLKKVLEVADKIAVITAGRLIYVEEVEKARKEIDNIQRLLFV